MLGSNYNYDSFGERTGRVTFAQSLVDATLDREYDYDHVGRLVEGHTGAEARAARYGQGAPADGPYSHSYRYDEWGNMWARVGWGGTNASYSASYTNNRRDGLGYDAAGNVVNDGGQSFQYDAAGKQSYASGTGLQQSYDGDGLRVKKVEQGVATYYVRSSVLGGQVVCEINGWGGWTRGYVYLGGQLVAIQDGQVIFVHQDPITKSQRLTDTAGNVVSGIELDPWGGETNRSWNQGRQPHQFTSYERDQNGSDDAQARRYNRWWSRFDQPDPFDGSYNLADPQSFNRYAYVQNDPVNMVDPTGLCSAPRGLSGGNTGICIEAFIAAPSIGGIGRGDNRGFSGNDANLTYRAQVQLVVTKGFPNNANHISANARAGRSDILFSGLGLRGSVSIDITNRKQNAAGGIDFTLSLTAKNGFSGVPFAPKGTIGANLNVSVNPDGTVSIAPDSEITGYPSFGVYSYNLVNGQTVSNTVYEKKESSDPGDLQRPMRRIGGGGGGGSLSLGGGFGGWTSIDRLLLSFGSGGGGYSVYEGPSNPPTSPPTLKYRL